MVDELFTPAFWWYAANKGLRILVILVGTGLVLHFLKVVVDQFFLRQANAKTIYFGEKRARTLGGVIKSILQYTLYFIALMMILQEFKIDTTSILAGAGIIGLAVGVGAQSLVKDIITGFFIILEDQYSVGDYIASGEMAGTVEEIGFRVTKLRDVNGVLHIIPNGAIVRISNYTRGHMQAVINVPVSYQADLNQVLELLAQACRETGEAVPEALEGPKVLGVVDFRPDSVIIRIIAKTIPLEQSKVETEVRRRIKLLFDAERVPPPASSVIVTGQGGSNEHCTV